MTDLSFKEAFFTRDTFNFNKQILLGEIGAVIGAPLSGHIASLFTHASYIISSVAVIGAIVGSGIVFLGTRAYDKAKQNALSKKEFARDLLFFTPVAFAIACCISYPTLYFLSKHLISYYPVALAIAVSEIAAFMLFLIAINYYRYLLMKHHGKVL